MSIPHSKLIELLQYKSFAQGLLFITTEESYTSKSSFLHNDPLPMCNKDLNINNSKEKKESPNNEIKGNINNKNP